MRPRKLCAWLVSTWSRDVELEGELVVDGLNELAQMRMQVTKRIGGTRALVATRHGQQGNVVLRAQVGGACGGYLLAVNSQGNRKLQQTSGACGVSTVASGQIGGFNAGGFSMEVDVLNGSLSAAIEGQTVVSGRSDGLNPSPGAEGLMEESSVATSSAILYRDFELDSWS